MNPDRFFHEAVRAGGPTRMEPGLCAVPPGRGRTAGKAV